MDRGVDGRGGVDASRFVVAVTLGKQLEQVQGAALALVGRDILEDGGGSAVVGDDDRALAFGGTVESSAAPRVSAVTGWMSSVRSMV